jgi:hypothetical protein
MRSPTLLAKIIKAFVAFNFNEHATKELKPLDPMSLELDVAIK